MRSSHRIHLVSDRRPRSLSLGDARDAAKAAYAEAKSAQRTLVTHLLLIELLHRPGRVSFARLKGERAEAHRQAERARAVVDALDRAIDAMEAADPEGNP